MKGLHSLDVGILITPVLIEFMKASAEQAEVNYVIGTEEGDIADEEDVAMAQTVASDLFKTKRPVEQLLEGEAEEEPEIPEDLKEKGDKPVRKGLMARKKDDEEVAEDGV
jgi:hypothetical protein